MLPLFIGSDLQPQPIPETVALYICITIFSILILLVIFEYLIGRYWQMQYARMVRKCQAERQRKQAIDTLISEPRNNVFFYLNGNRLRVLPKDRTIGKLYLNNQLVGKVTRFHIHL
jgi:hypothetical protein